MNGKGWKPEYGISAEGIELLGYLEALPRDARLELLQEVAAKCRSAGYLSLHDDLRAAVQAAEKMTAGEAAGAAEVEAQPGKVIPLFRKRGQG